ncbi:MAG: sensor histidine kinase [Chloroflexota bacterium]
MMDIFQIDRPSKFWLLMSTAYVTIIGVGIALFLKLSTVPQQPVPQQPLPPHFSFLPNTVTQQSLAMALLFVFAATITITYFFHRTPLYVHLYMFIEVLIATLIFSINPERCTDVVILFFILSGSITIFLPLRTASAWIVAIYAFSLSSAGYALGLDAVLNMLSAAGGHMLFAAFGYMVRKSDEDHRHTQTLLSELQVAHQQLQEYAAQSQQLAVAEERNRLAREMHDSLGHRLTVAVLQLEGARRLIPIEPDRAAETVGAMRTQLKDALAELRKTVSTLRETDTGSDSVSDSVSDTAIINDSDSQVSPEIFAQSTLRTDLMQMVHTFQEATGLRIHTEIPQEQEIPHLPPTHRLALYRAAQESLTNVQRHAVASQAWLSLVIHDAVRIYADGPGVIHTNRNPDENGLHYGIQDLPPTISLTVADDGQGMPPTIEDGRFGLTGLRERAQQFNGHFFVGPRTEGGTIVRFDIPLNKKTT